MAVLRILGILLLALHLSASSAHAARLKDIADVEGVRGNQLYGYGLVVGLNGTGDGKSVEFTVKSISNLLQRAGVQVPQANIKVKNVAAVIVTGTLPAFARPGSKLDITISSIGDAKSLQGGTLLFTPLLGADGNTYAVGQGEMNVGGFSIEGGGDSTVKNHPTVGNIAGGATVERAIPFDLFQSQRIRVVLRQPDFTTMTKVVESVNQTLARPLAVAVDGSSLEIPIPMDLRRDPIGLLAQIEQSEVEIDVGARIVVNEKTGTVIMGEHVTVSRVALAHGNLNISIRSEVQVSQPGGLAQAGQTAVVQNADVTVGEEERGLSLLGGEQVTLGEVVQALNALGATPRDLISIFSALKRAGALHAELVVM